MRRSASGSASRSGRAVPRRYERGSTPTICTRRPRSVDDPSLVGEHGRRAEVGDRARLGERVARSREVVVAEHRERAGHLLEERAQPRLGARAREEVAGDHGELGLPLGGPLDSALDGAFATRREAEMEVREVRDTQALQLGRQARQRHGERPEPHPPRFEVSPRGGCQTKLRKRSESSLHGNRLGDLGVIGICGQSHWWRPRACRSQPAVDLGRQPYSRRSRPAALPAAPWRPIGRSGSPTTAGRSCGSIRARTA